MATNTYVPLATQTLSSNQSSVTFSSIPSTYTDLILIGSAKRNVAGSGDDNYNVTFNGDTGNNYSVTLLYENSPYSTRSSNRANLNWMGATGSAENIPSIVHIMNYSNSTTFKTALGRWGSPSDGIVRASVGLWRNTNAITSLTITPAQGIANGSTFSLYGVAAEGTSPAPKATGGAIYSDSLYYYHVFGATGTFTPTQSLTADVLVVAGGGGGGADMSGGGGAGGLLGFTSQSLTTTNYTVTVGAGGSGGSSSGALGSNGSNSQFGALTACIGGGRSGNYLTVNGASGGSGGGAGRNSGGSSGGAGTSGQGNAGGNGSRISSDGETGGGGGAGGAGQSGGTGYSGDGGVGSSAYSSWGLATGTGQNVGGTYYYAGGGGGGWQDNSTVTGSGGYGGGGNGAAASVASVAGMANTGGGGGGGAGGGSIGRAGGSGVVIVRYAKA